MRAPRFLVVIAAALAGPWAGGCAVERGLDCSPDEACAEGLECEARGDGTSVCVPPGGPRLLREPCREDALCGPGGVCIVGAESSLCLIEDNAPCFEDNECVSGACDSRCEATACDVGVSCPCARDDDCGGEEVCGGSQCGRQCVPPAARGDVCATRQGGTCDAFKTCGEGLTCAVFLGAIDDGLCVPPTDREAGEICNRPEECASGECTAGACA